VGVGLLYWGIANVGTVRLAVIPDLAAAAAAILLIVGLYTSVAGVLIVVAQALMVISPAFAHHGPPSIRIFLAALSASVVMLGPGAMSLDAQRFGRKVFEIRESRRPDE
jgi:putative oxidoreductase